jgi:putative transcriptional regulator
MTINPLLQQHTPSVNLSIKLITNPLNIYTEHKVKLQELSEHLGVNLANLYNLKTGNVKAIRFSTLEAICVTLNYQPGDILEYDQES